MSFSFFVIFSLLFLADPLRSWCSSLRAVQPFSLYSGLGGSQACNPTGQRCNFHGVHASHKWSRFVNSYLKDSQAFPLSAHIFMDTFYLKCSHLKTFWLKCMDPIAISKIFSYAADLVHRDFGTFWPPPHILHKIMHCTYALCRVSA